ncbi:MAG: hypothetical protein FJZ59_01450 [Chlamydiae bacterium]|jgi:hypothetical protein|nr:hypothetical protein [Chlamydiota bacterium]
MELISIRFDENEALEAAKSSFSALEIVLPEPLNEAVWERLLVIKELSYPLPILVVFSEAWKQTNLEDILTRLATANVTGILLKNPIDKAFLDQVNRINNLGLSII